MSVCRCSCHTAGLVRRKTLPKARTGWALDSGGFSELSLYGGWWTTPEEYVLFFRGGGPPPSSSSAV
jgi:hypothetical protein